MRILALALLFYSSAAMARDTQTSAALFAGLSEVGLANEASSATCTMQVGKDPGKPSYHCELKSLRAGSSASHLRGPKAEAMLSALQSLNVAKGEGGASAEYIRCEAFSGQADRAVECFVATFIDCDEGILFCRDR